MIDHFAALKKDAGFQNRFDKFPVEFFGALRYLQMSGAPEKDGLVFVADSRNRINAALLIAHALTAKNPAVAGEGRLLAPQRRIVSTARGSRRKGGDARAMGGRESRRGNYVYGVYDGVARWIAVMMGEKGCFAAEGSRSIREPWRRRQKVRARSGEKDRRRHE